MNYYLNAIKNNYTNFSGRARRREYWMFVLFNMLFAFVAAIIDHLLGTTLKIDTMMGTQTLPYGYVYLVYMLAMFLPSLALAVRRLHDVGKSGWFFLIAIIPLIGAIWLLVLFCTDGTTGENTYGVNPKESV